MNQARLGRNSGGMEKEKHSFEKLIGRQKLRMYIQSIRFTQTVVRQNEFCHEILKQKTQLRFLMNSGNLLSPCQTKNCFTLKRISGMKDVGNLVLYGAEVRIWLYL